MTKKQFAKHCLDNGCTSHYQGHTKTMFVFGSSKNLLGVGGGGYRGGWRYTPDWLTFGVVMQATS